MFDKFPVAPQNASVAVPGTGPQLPSAHDLWRFLYMHQVYDPDRVKPEEAYKYVVPREGEVVYDHETSILYRCVHVDYEGKTLKPTFDLAIKGNGGAEGDYDYDREIFGLEGGFNGEGVVGVDYSVRPNIAVVDQQITCANAAYAVLYKGSTLTKENIISATYSSVGVMSSFNIPVSLAAIDRLDNKTIMVTDKFSVRLNEQELPPGSRCTLMFYDAAGNSISRPRILNVQHTKVLRDHQIGRRYIKDVQLAAPWFMDSTQPNTMNLPINTQIKTIAFLAMVYYSNGEVEERYIDGKKIRLLGLDSHTPTAPTQTTTLTLAYNFDKDEAAYEAQAGVADKYCKDYLVYVTPFDGAYSPKLYVVTKWNGKNYDLKFYLMDLDRKWAIDVTDKVYPNEASPAFRPASYGVEQTLEYNLRLSDASKNFKPLIMRQSFTILLKKPGGEVGSKWAVRYSYLGDNYDDPAFKASHHVEGTRLDATAGIGFYDEWLQKLYYNLEPSVNTTREKKPIIPTHFEMIDKADNVWRFSVSDWEEPLRFNKKFEDDELLTIRWLSVAADGSVKVLAVGGTSVQY